MKKILGLLVIVLGLTGCQMNVAPAMEEQKSNIEWVSNIESRAAQTTTRRNQKNGSRKNTR